MVTVHVEIKGIEGTFSLNRGGLLTCEGVDLINRASSLGGERESSLELLFYINLISFNVVEDDWLSYVLALLGNLKDAWV